MQRRVFLYADGANHACLCRASWGQCDATCAGVPVCSSACFCGLNPRTVPHRSLNKFSGAPLGNRGLVLGLNVSCFFRSLGTSNGARAEQTRPSRSRRHNYVTIFFRAVLQSNVLHLRLGVGQNVAIHTSPIAINDKLRSLCPLCLW